MWRKTVSPQGGPADRELLPLLLPRRSLTRALVSHLSFWAPTSRASTTRAACFFQHVSATTWLRAS
ncbi:MAG: hypothetical protein ACXV2G_07100 [Actinomycetes bacterium]